MNIDWLENSIIFECISGSHAYGLNTPESDTDYRGICIPPEDYFLGVYSFDQHEQKDPDRTIFNIKKFVNLAIENNPNILEFLYMPEDCIIKTTEIWERFVKNRALFLSKKVKFTYAGYAYSQLRRIKSHKSWLLNPPDHKPERKEFGIIDASLSKADYGMLESLETKEQLSTLTSKEVISIYLKEKSYRSALKHYNQYQEWVKNRNVKRAELEKKFGYDTKHMGHVFRLLLQGEHILKENTLPVRLNDEDRKYILDIKAGKYQYDELLSAADKRMQDFETLYSSSTLQHSPDIVRINQVLKETLHQYFIGN